MLLALTFLLLTTNPSFGETHQPHPAASVRAIATGYCLSGRRTATDKVVYAGCVALSRSLARALDAHYGDRIMIDGLGVFTYDDRSPQKFLHADVHFPRYRDAASFGKREVLVWKLGGS